MGRKMYLDVTARVVISADECEGLDEEIHAVLTGEDSDHVDVLEVSDLNYTIIDSK